MSSGAILLKISFNLIYMNNNILKITFYTYDKYQVL
jgi:hypothetical protein